VVTGLSVESIYSRGLLTFSRLFKIWNDEFDIKLQNNNFNNQSPTKTDMRRTVIYPLLTVVALINSTGAVQSESTVAKALKQKSASLSSNSGSGISFADFGAKVREMQR